MRVLMETGEAHEVTEHQVYLLPDGTTQLIFTTETGASIVLEVTDEDLRVLGEGCMASVERLPRARQMLKARNN